MRGAQQRGESFRSPGRTNCSSKDTVLRSVRLLHVREWPNGALPLTDPIARRRIGLRHVESAATEETMSSPHPRCVLAQRGRNSAAQTPALGWFPPTQGGLSPPQQPLAYRGTSQYADDSRKAN